KVSLQVARDALQMQGIDTLGLDQQDRKYLQTIVRVFAGGPVGVEAVGHTINVPVDTLIDEVEPYLLRSELIIRTPRGRRVTPAGFEHLGLSAPMDDQRSLF
ncbi:MAG: Holliday junction branch migration DNA helicase RuvB, partial [Pirellulales bacterium]|nr:Holliday junction branch migration DNA helicase RuvB [Pirellulales bacterium]